jgi:AraC family transcriptional regulator
MALAATSVRWSCAAPCAYIAEVRKSQEAKPVLKKSLVPVASTSPACDDAPLSIQQRRIELPTGAPAWTGVRPDLGRGDRPSARGRSLVAISPEAAVRRRAMRGRGMTAELVQSASRDRIEFRHRGASHLFVAWEQGVRGEGETSADGAPTATLHDLTWKLTFVPAGRDYLEWLRPSTATRVMCFSFDAAELERQFSQAFPDIPLAPRLLFEDATLWSTVLKLKGLIESPLPAHQPYFEALSTVLMQELARSSGGTGHCGSSARGGLAPWQQRVVAAHIEEHVAEQIPLAALARLARLSPYHFSRAFKRSFGVPPHRYHTNRRIERAKALLQERTRSVTDIGLALGFRETSSFTAAFRKTTGLTPSRYNRSLG